MTDLWPKFEAMLQGIVEEKVRDATRELESRLEKVAIERANVCEARDALREQVQALELKLLEVRKAAEVEPAEPVEVDGFRVGDLVRHEAWKAGVFHALTRFERGLLGTVHAYFDEGGGWLPSRLTRKPVEVGDRVRSVLSDQQAQVFSGDAFAWDVRLPHGQVVKWSRDACIAIAK